MMKKYYFLLIFSFAVVLISSCKKDFLDRAPKSAISDGDFWRSENDLRLYVNNYYNGLPSYIQQFFTFGPYSEDDAQGSDNMINKEYNRALNGEITLPSSGGGWSYGDWGNIRSVNYFLGNYHQVVGDPAEINKYVGEALFFKAWFYYDKLKSFGDLPWLSKALVPNDSTILQSPRLSRDIVVDSIMQILDIAVAYLPSKGESRYEDFRVYKELAALFQSRIALYEGTWEKYHAGTDYGVSGKDGTKFLQKAADAALLVMESGKFDIENIGEENGYWNLFNQLSYAGNREVMFWRQYQPDDGNYTFWANYGRLGGGRGITRSLVDSYLMKDGTPISASPNYKGDLTLVNVVKDRDPRLNQTIAVNDGKHFITDTVTFKHPTWDQAAEDNNYTGYQIYKGLNTSSQQQTRGNGSQGLIYFRYAEALLNFAEAKAELGTLTQDDLDNTINLLRDRVEMAHLKLSGIANDPQWQFPNLSPIINEVRRERRVEFAAEGYRHDDIWRWAAAGKLIRGWKPQGAKQAQFLTLAEDADDEARVLALFPVDADNYISPYKNNVVGANGYGFRENKDYLRPIPQDQRLLNPGLSQNPGW